MSDQDDRDDEVRALLRRLTEWERGAGSRFAEDPALRGTGEAAAAIDELKRRLDRAGARYHWRRTERAYVLDGLGPPPGGEDEPEPA